MSLSCFDAQDRLLQQDVGVSMQPPVEIKLVDSLVPILSIPSIAVFSYSPYTHAISSQFIASFIMKIAHVHALPE